MPSIGSCEGELEPSGIKVLASILKDKIFWQHQGVGMAEVDSGDTSSERVAPIVAEPVVIPPAEARRGRGLIGGILGGVLAAGAGFGVAQYVPNGWPLADVAALQAQIAAQEAAVATLNNKVSELTAVSQSQSELADRVSALEESAKSAPVAPDLAQIEDRISKTEQDLTAVLALPASDGVSPAQLMQITGEIAALRQQVLEVRNAGGADQTGAAQALVAQVEDATKQMKDEARQMVLDVRKTAAVARLQSAIDLGGAFETALPALGNVPAVLSDSAAQGVPTLASLQASFPAVARAALESALQADMGESWSERVVNFLKAQTGARSLEPRDGADPDAILSRAEAALAAGDVASALNSLSELPDAAKAPIADWVSDAQRRQAVVDAVAALSLASQE